MIKYKIGTEFLDQFDSNSSFAITKAVSKIGEINLRHGDRSTGFKVPLTAKNTKLLNYVTIINSSTSNQSFQRIQGKLVEDDVVISDGYFQVTKFNPYKKEVDMRFYGGNTDWFSELKDRKINESYTDENNYNVNDILNVIISPQKIEESFINDLSESYPYKFFLVDNNRDTERNTLNDITLDTTVRDWQIGVSQGVIFNRIMDSIGIKTKGNIFNDPKYYKTLISGSKDLEILSNKVNYTDFIEMSENKQFLQTDIYSNLSFTENSFLSNEWSGDTVILNGDCSNAIINFEVNFSGPNSFTSRELTYKVIKNIGQLNESQILEITIPLTAIVQVPNSSGGVVGFSSYYAVDDVDLSTSFIDGDTITVQYKTNIQDNVPNVDYYAADLTNGTNPTPTIPFFEFILEDYVKPTTGNEVLPDISQADFIKDTLIQFGAISQYDVKTKTLTCNKFDIIDDNKRNAINWSSRVDLSSLPNVNLTKVLSNYGKKSFFKYNEVDDSDVLNTLYKAITNYQLGDGFIEIDNGFLTDEKDIYTSPYSPTIMVGTFPFSNDDPNNRANFFLPFVPLYTRTAIDEWEENDIGAKKYLYVDDVNIMNAYRGSTEFINIDDVTQIASMPLVYFDKSDYPYNYDSIINDYKEGLSFGKLIELNKNDNNGQILENTNTSTTNSTSTLLNQYYSFQKSVLNKPIYLEINLMLTSLDVQNVDFFTPIFLNFGLDSGYYYIDEISQYKGQDKSTKVKLVKI